MLEIPVVTLTNIVACAIDGGYESDSEEGQDAGEGQAEVIDDAAHCFREHTGSVDIREHVVSSETTVHISLQAIHD